MKEVIRIKIDNIVPNKSQPRLDFYDESLKGLAESIKENGLLQPITVRKISANKYELIAGERRLRATKLNNEKEILAIVLDKSDEESANLALVENLQREDLNAMEQALAMNYLMHYNNLTQAELASKLGYKQSTVANKLRLLKLPNYVKQALSLGTITERHARALLKVDESQMEDIFLTIINRKYNVAKTEEYIKGLSQRKKEKGISSNSLLAVNTIKEAYELCRKSGLDVDIRQTEYNDHIKIVLSIKK